MRLETLGHPPAQDRRGRPGTRRPTAHSSPRQLPAGCPKPSPDVDVVAIVRLAAPHRAAPQRCVHLGRRRRKEPAAVVHLDREEPAGRGRARATDVQASFPSSHRDPGPVPPAVRLRRNERRGGRVSRGGQHPSGVLRVAAAGRRFYRSWCASRLSASPRVREIEVLVRALEPKRWRPGISGTSCRDSRDFRMVSDGPATCRVRRVRIGCGMGNGYAASLGTY